MKNFNQNRTNRQEPVQCLRVLIVVQPHQPSVDHSLRVARLSDLANQVLSTRGSGRCRGIATVLLFLKLQNFKYVDVSS